VAEGRWNFSISGAGHTRKASRLHRSFGTNPSFQLEGDAPSAPKLQVRSAVYDTKAAPPQKWDGSAIHPYHFFRKALPRQNVARASRLRA